MTSSSTSTSSIELQQLFEFDDPDVWVEQLVDKDITTTTTTTTTTIIPTISKGSSIDSKRDDNGSNVSTNSNIDINRNVGDGIQQQQQHQLQQQQQQQLQQQQVYMNQIATTLYNIENNYCICHYCSKFYVAPVILQDTCAHIFCSYCIRIKCMNDIVHTTIRKPSCPYCKTFLVGNGSCSNHNNNNSNNNQYERHLYPNHTIDTFVQIYKSIRQELFQTLYQYKEQQLQGHDDEREDRTTTTTTRNTRRIFQLDLSKLLHSIQNAEAFLEQTIQEIKHRRQQQQQQQLSNPNSMSQNNYKNNNTYSNTKPWWDYTTNIQPIEDKLHNIIFAPILQYAMIDNNNNNNNNNKSISKLPELLKDGPRSTLPKTIYNGCNKKKLMELCQQMGLSTYIASSSSSSSSSSCSYHTNNNNDAIVSYLRKKHSDFIVLYNSECDTLRPRSKEVLLRLYEQQYRNMEKEKIQQQQHHHHHHPVISNSNTKSGNITAATKTTTTTTASTEAVSETRGDGRTTRSMSHNSNATKANTTTIPSNHDRKYQSSAINYEKCIEILKQQRKILGESTLNQATTTTKGWKSVLTGNDIFDTELEYNYQQLILNYYKKYPKEYEKQQNRIHQYRTKHGMISSSSTTNENITKDSSTLLSSSSMSVLQPTASITNTANTEFYDRSTDLSQVASRTAAKGLMNTDEDHLMALNETVNSRCQPITQTNPQQQQHQFDSSLPASDTASKQQIEINSEVVTTNHTATLTPLSTESFVTFSLQRPKSYPHNDSVTRTTVSSKTRSTSMTTKSQVLGSNPLKRKSVDNRNPYSKSSNNCNDGPMKKQKQEVMIVDESSLIGPWICTYCTYYNQKDRSTRARCEMCQYIRCHSSTKKGKISFVSKQQQQHQEEPPMDSNGNDNNKKTTIAPSSSSSKSSTNSSIIEIDC